MTYRIIFLFNILVNINFSYATEEIEKYAILIGNQNYEHIPKLKNPLNDINAIKNVCLRENYQVFEFKDLKKVDFDKMLDSIERIIPKNKKVKIFIHYSGHGLQYGNENYFVPIDCGFVENASQLKRYCYPFSLFLSTFDEIIENNKDLHGLISIDACRKNPFQFENKSYGLNTTANSNNIVYNYFDIIFSASSNETAEDGRGKISPYVKGLISGIENCKNVPEIIREIRSKYAIEDVNNVKPFSLGQGNFLFCESGLNNVKENSFEIVRDLYFKVNQDFDIKKFEQVISKVGLINSYINEKGKKHLLNDTEKLTLRLITGIAYFELNKLSESIEDLYYTFENSNSPETYTIYCDSYFFLTKIFYQTEDWEKLKQIRLERVKYLQENNIDLDLAITYDKIGGDFEFQGNQDSAIVMYKSALRIFENIIPDSSEDLSHFKFLSLSNLGNCYGYGKNLNLDSSQLYLKKSILINGISENDWHYAMNSIIGHLLNDSLSEENYNQIKECLNKIEEKNKSSKSEYHDFLYNDFYMTFADKYSDINRIIQYHSAGHDQIISKINSSKINDNLFEKCVDEFCTIKYRNISITLESNIIPILFFDINPNNLFDSLDFQVNLINAEIDTVINNQVGQNSSEFTVQYERINMAKRIGLFDLQSNNQKISDGFCIAYPNDSMTTWNWNISCSELPISNCPVFIGFKNVMTTLDGSKIYIDNIIQYYPVISSNSDSNQFSLSTLGKKK